jgi:hypothetical protein
MLPPGCSIFFAKFVSIRLISTYPNGFCISINGSRIFPHFFEKLGQESPIRVPLTAMLNSTLYVWRGLRKLPLLLVKFGPGKI